MKKTFIESIKIIAVALVIGWGVSGVSAFTPGTFPAGQVPAVINTSADNQTKVGGLLSEKFLVSDLGFFTKTLLPGKDSWLNIGSRLNVAPGAINNNGSTIPLTIDVTGRATVTKDGTEGQNAINFISGQTSCSTATAFINDRASAFEFTSGSTDTGHADLIARQLQLSGGSPQDGSVLASDANGNAVWAKLVVQGGVLKVINNQTGFPVVADADCNPPAAPHWDIVWGGCKTIYDGSATTNIQPGQTVEYGTATCKNSNNQIVTGCTGAPWTDMDGTSPMRSANRFLSFCATPPEPAVAEQYGCHVIGSSGYWIKNRHTESSYPYAPRPKCTSVYIPPLDVDASGNVRYAFSEGDVICSITQPSSAEGSPTWCTMPHSVDEDGDGVMDYRIDATRNSSSPYKPCTQFQATCPN
jgi:hypothetical protein